MTIALCLGGAKSLWPEYDEAITLIDGGEYIVVACNHAGRDAPFPIDHFCTMHSELFPMWIRTREKKGYPMPRQFHHAGHRTGFRDSKPIESWGGSSGLLCVKLAIDLGCDKIILAGIPMNQNGRHYDRDKKWHEARQYHSAWQRHVDEMQGRVKSFSGWTADLLGVPTKEWLYGEQRRT